MTTLICNCNQTLPLDLPALSRTLGEPLAEHSALCRREAAQFVKACETGQPLQVGCTQEAALFTELAGQRSAPIRFFNIRETAGWSAEGRAATPKIAALIAQAQWPDPEPVPTVSYRSAGRALVIGPLDRAEQVAAWLQDRLQLSLFATGPGEGGGAQSRNFPTLSGKLTRIQGFLGQFEVSWETANPIDLDLCTRCNACVAACPEGAIDLDYQIDLARCTSHRDCVRVCQVAGAIHFEREPVRDTERFDLVLDLRPEGQGVGPQGHAKPQGYLRWDGKDLGSLLAWRETVGEFEKPRFFSYSQKLCAHTRNEKLGCQACVDICSAEAIRSNVERQRIEVDPHLCVGCGACTTACPSGALSYAYPKLAEQSQRLRQLVADFTRAGGKDPMVLLHSQGQGQERVMELGRQASLKLAAGLPAQVIPYGLWHTASLGLDAWLDMLAHGAAQVLILCTDEEAPAYLDVLGQQAQVANSLMDALGFGPDRVRILRARDAQDLDAHLRTAVAAWRASKAPAIPRPHQAMGLPSGKRSALDASLSHLLAQAPTRPAPGTHVSLPAGSPWGTVNVDAQRCTMCLSCVNACPAGALGDNPERPQLRLTESKCVQCGLCVRTCPERALSLEPRLLLGPQRAESRVLNETQPYACVRCGKPFGTVQAIEAMLSRLSGHAMFQGAAAERLKMCGDCRVIDIYSSDKEQRITDH